MLKCIDASTHDTIFFFLSRPLLGHYEASFLPGRKERVRLDTSLSPGASYELGAHRREDKLARDRSRDASLLVRGFLQRESLCWAQNFTPGGQTESHRSVFTA